MKLVYAIRIKEDPKHPAARHLDNGNGREPIVWAAEEGEPTCKICIDLAVMRGESAIPPENQN